MFSSSHLHIFTCFFFLSLSLFSSSHLHIFSSSHLHIFSSSHLHIFTSSLSLSFSPSLPFSLSLSLCLLPSSVTVSLLLFLFSLKAAGSADEAPRSGHFDFETCFAPQRRALFEHLNFQKWSDVGVLCTFWLRNVLRATTACNFSSLIWPDGSAPAASAYFSTLRSHKSLEKQSESWLFYLFAHLHLLVFDVVKFTNWGSLAELLRFGCCQAQKLRKSRWIA